MSAPSGKKKPLAAQMARAASWGNLSKVQELLKNAGSSDERRKLANLRHKDALFPCDLPGNAWTPLHFACRYSGAVRGQIVELLIRNGANINATDSLGWTPGHVASRFGAYLALEQMFQAQDEEVVAAVRSTASKYILPPLVELVVEYCADTLDVQALTHDGESMLMLAAWPMSSFGDSDTEDDFSETEMEASRDLLLRAGARPQPP